MSGSTILAQLDAAMPDGWAEALLRRIRDEQPDEVLITLPRTSTGRVIEIRISRPPERVRRKS